MKQLLLITALFLTQLSFGQAPATSNFCKSCKYSGQFGSFSFCYLYDTQAEMNNSNCPVILGFTLTSESNNLLGCSPTDCNFTISLLPVELLDFVGLRKNNSVELKWITSSELNNKGFEIQRSTDGLNWKAIDFIQGNGDSKKATYYHYSDKTVVNEKNYYRLKQVDETETYTFSEIIEISSDKDSEMVVYPNPVADYVGIRNVIGDVTIFDTNGRVVRKQTIKEEGINMIQLEQLQSGIYIIQATSKDGHIATKKVIKQ